jgi:hypothetical protein
MLRNIWVAAPAAIAPVACTSCATLFQGTSEKITLASDPSGASSAVNGWAVGRHRIFDPRKS